MNLAVGGLSRRTSGLVLLMTLTLVTACGSPALASPDPTDPREIVARALQNTAALRTARFAILVESWQVEGPGETILDAKGDVDFVSRELAATATEDLFSTGSASTADVIVADGLIYIRSDAQQWSVSGRRGQDPWAGAPTTAELAAAIETAIEDPATSVTLLDPVAECGQAGCHRVQAIIPRGALWKAFRPLVEQLAGQQPTEPPSYIPEVTVDAWVEKGTLRLMQGTNSAKVLRTYIEVSFVLSRHDEPIDIVAPSGAPQP